jgi:NAD(P)-dependent dehydrogenase (short-subunit alcohol dehydrogenase family)
MGSIAFDFTGDVVVTGISSGIGRAIALDFADSGRP